MQVKGPRDHLSQQQRAWLAALARVGLRAEVLKVGALFCVIVAWLCLAAPQRVLRGMAAQPPCIMQQTDAEITLVCWFGTGGGAQYSGVEAPPAVVSASLPPCGPLYLPD